MMSVEITEVSQCRVGLAPTLLAFRLLTSGGDGRPHLLGALGGDDGVPGFAGGDDGVEVPQDGGRDHGLGLGDGQLVDVAFGQVAKPGCVDGIRALCSPHGPPGRNP